MGTPQAIRGVGIHLGDPLVSFNPKWPFPNDLTLVEAFQAHVAEYMCQVVRRIMTDVKKSSWQERLRQDPWQGLIRLVKTGFFMC